jgi:hypothetical protein
MALGSNELLTEMSTKNLPGGKGWPEHKADNLTAICEPIVLKMCVPRRVNRMGLHGPLQGYVYLFFSNELKTEVTDNRTSVRTLLFTLDSFHLFTSLNIILNI